MERPITARTALRYPAECNSRHPRYCGKLLGLAKVSHKCSSATVGLMIPNQQTYRKIFTLIGLFRLQIEHGQPHTYPVRHRVVCRPAVTRVLGPRTPNNNQHQRQEQVQVGQVQENGPSRVPPSSTRKPRRTPRTVRGFSEDCGVSDACTVLLSKEMVGRPNFDRPASTESRIRVSNCGATESCISGFQRNAQDVRNSENACPP